MAADDGPSVLQIGPLKLPRSGKASLLLLSSLFLLFAFLCVVFLSLVRRFVVNVVGIVVACSLGRSFSLSFVGFVFDRFFEARGVGLGGVLGAKLGQNRFRIVSFCYYFCMSFEASIFERFLLFFWRLGSSKMRFSHGRGVIFQAFGLSHLRSNMPPKTDLKTAILRSQNRSKFGRWGSSIPSRCKVDF